MKKLLVGFLLFSISKLVAQNTFLFTTKADNITSNYAIINLPQLNNQPNTIVAVESNADSRRLNPHPIGVWYTGKNWSIFNQDKAAMTVGVTYKITISNQAATVKATNENINGNKMFIDVPAINNNPSASFSVTQNWNPSNVGGTYNNSDIEISYENALSKWIITNTSGNAIPTGAAFNIVAKNNETPSPIDNKPELTVVTQERPSNPIAAPQSDPAIYQFLTNNQGPTYPQTKLVNAVGGGTPKSTGTKEQDYKLVNYVAENVVFNPQADALFAGNLIQSKDFFEKTLLTPLNKNIKPGTITMVGGNGPGRGSRSKVLENNTISAYQDGVNEIINGISLQNSVGSNEFKFTSCRTAEQGLVEAKVNVRTTNFRARGDFSYEYSFEKSVVVGVLTQKYYSITYTPNSNKQNLFASGITLAELQREGLVSNDNRPAYISQVDYGRIFIIVAESDASQSELKTFIEANYRGGATTVDAEVRFNQLKRSSNLSIKILSVGSNNNAGELNDVSPQAFKDFLAQGATASVQNPGAIIGYRVRDLISNRDIPTMLTADYSELEWDGSTVDRVEYVVKPGDCADCVQNGVRSMATNGQQLMLKKGDVVNFATEGRATHGPWLWTDAKGPEGQPGERTDRSDKLQCPNEKNECECNRYAIIANIPNGNKMWTCIGAGVNNFVVPSNMAVPLGFTFNDYKTDDGEGQYKVTVSRIPYHTVIKRK
ncbi:MAG: thiol-activated cytolysin family protein [Ferruginibacter sp.]|nr:thiol-activated cytolysin family protein [Ferruginibacter sp.]